jgi:hypothetical protein
MFIQAEHFKTCDESALIYLKIFYFFQTSFFFFVNGLIFILYFLVLFVLFNKTILFQKRETKYPGTIFCIEYFDPI